MGGASTVKKVQSKFKFRGYTLKKDAFSEIISFVNRFPDAEDDAIDLLLDQLEIESLKSSVLDKETVHKVLSLLSEAEAVVSETPSSTTSSRSALRIIDAFLVPKFRYDPIRKVFYEHTGKLPIHGDASAKATLYKDRYLLLLQRLSRDPHFSKPAFDSETSQLGTCEISPIQSLIGQTGKKWVMGVISQLEDGHFFLEDLTASVEINLSNAKITTGFFSENTVVIAEGQLLLDGIFQVSTCGFPPLEDRNKSLDLLAGIDLFASGTFTMEETCRKQKDLYMWIAKTPGGPSVKFLVNAVHTMEELKLTGNHLKGSRPLLTFSNNFDKDTLETLKRYDYTGIWNPQGSQEI